ILDKIDQERELSFSGMRATPYAWIYTMGTFGIVYPAIGELWTEWWRCGMPGRACGVLQYASVLMYPDEANPIFSPWTPDAGGGPPVPWETDGLIFDKPWLPENVDFLRTTLTTNYVWQAISTAAAVLHGASDASVAEGMVDDFEGRAAFVECRIQELIQYLSLPLGAVRQWITT
ncbi:MAG: hypothetical protein GX748_18240, partial [Lentisphaerae bacterium]|nr:hypothetical protein [Lentisphaerota bacterium]